MQFMDFTYNKADNKSSDRTIVVLGRPSETYFGIDVSDMLNDDFANFTVEFQAVLREFEQKKADLMEKYDLKYNYRQFKPERMEDVSVYYGSHE